MLNPQPIARVNQLTVGLLVTPSGSALIINEGIPILVLILPRYGTFARERQTILIRPIGAIPAEHTSRPCVRRVLKLTACEVRLNNSLQIQINHLRALQSHDITRSKNPLAFFLALKNEGRPLIIRQIAFQGKGHVNISAVHCPLFTSDENQGTFSLDISRSGDTDSAYCKVSLFNTPRANFACHIFDSHDIHDPQGSALGKNQVFA